jgi:hypothetical protein
MSDDIVARLRSVLHNDRSVELMNTEAADEIERLRDERDEARREVCHVFETNLFRDAGMFRTASSVAIERGWDCYEEGLEVR